MENLWNALLQTPLLGWVGYVHLSRPSRKECENKHQSVDERENSMCSKMDALHTDIREIRTILIQHVSDKG
jgi:hypothetical protein